MNFLNLPNAVSAGHLLLAVPNDGALTGAARIYRGHVEWRRYRGSVDRDEAARAEVHVYFCPDGFLRLVSSAGARYANDNEQFPMAGIDWDSIKHFFRRNWKSVYSSAMLGEVVRMGARLATHDYGTAVLSERRDHVRGDAQYLAALVNKLAAHAEAHRAPPRTWFRPGDIDRAPDMGVEQMGATMLRMMAELRQLPGTHYQVLVNEGEGHVRRLCPEARADRPRRRAR